MNRTCFVVLIASVLAGCNAASLTEVGDAGQASCDEHGVTFCDAGAPTGCVGDPKNATTQYLPTTPVPVGCKANIVGGAADSTGICSLLSSCVCSVTDGGTTAAWQCSP